MSTSIAVLGGTFNPPHLGHIQGALQVIEHLGIPQLGLMPCKLPPHKTTAGVSEHHRVAMVSLLCDSNPGLYPELIELDLPAPSYSVKTLRALRRQHPGSPLLFVMGEDSLNTLESWYQWRTLLSLCHVIVMRRQDLNVSRSAELNLWIEEHRCHDPAMLSTTRWGQLYIAQTELHQASSTAIRNEAAKSGAMMPEVAQWLPDEIISYINQHKLYANVK
ncbi:nicotinate (nicotinamide) nucleotide adenylyltransferase [Alteromonas halophila]|uniref:Probable nicotinate-nucleotide adenylyltransferase n=1 Tax=Alteromonas halophila TaxID=516698 RepID=A0A918JET6_9ALTE|nr:nicotinate (nicotinamide) nucleotide adenylyltransferase [Alteromonas halophila]GGW77182.1 putative nicotinate-nucleotide adenylyltransferase [Alteromonas halophila]